jgi:hypothetical protein
MMRIQDQATAGRAAPEEDGQWPGPGLSGHPRPESLAYCDGKIKMHVIL